MVRVCIVPTVYEPHLDVSYDSYCNVRTDIYFHLPMLVNNILSVWWMSLSIMNYHTETPVMSMAKPLIYPSLKGADRT